MGYISNLFQSSVNSICCVCSAKNTWESFPIKSLSAHTVISKWPHCIFSIYMYVCMVLVRRSLFFYCDWILLACIAFQSLIAFFLLTAFNNTKATERHLMIDQVQSLGNSTSYQFPLNMIMVMGRDTQYNMATLCLIVQGMLRGPWQHPNLTSSSFSFRSSWRKATCFIRYCMSLTTLNLFILGELRKNIHLF